MLRASRSILLAAPLIALLAILVFFFGFRDDPAINKIAARMSDTHQLRLLGGDREALLLLPRAYAPGQSLLLILGLHAYDSNAWEYDQYLQLSPAVHTDRVALLLPHGLKDSENSRYWSATPWCCDHEGSGVDDLAYLRTLAAEAGEAVKLHGVVAVGQGNGAFMAQRLACDGLPGLIGVAALGGSSFADSMRCDGAAPVSVLQIHGDADEQVTYAGAAGGDYPGAEALAQRWAGRAGCALERPEQLQPLDLVPNLAGAETAVQRWTSEASGCTTDHIAELWTIKGGGHAPDGGSAIGARILEWLAALCARVRCPA